LPEAGLRIKKEYTYNTLENRFVKWILSRIIHKIDDLLVTLESKKRFEVKPDSELIYSIAKMKNRLIRIKDNPFWKQIGKLDRPIMSLVIQLAPVMPPIVKTQII